MRRVLIIFIVFSLFISGCTSPTDSILKAASERKSIAFDDWVIPRTFIPQQLNVVGLGDSLTQGVGDELKKGGYFGRLANEEMVNWSGVKNVEALNLAKRGRKSDQLINQLENEEIQDEVKSADIILFTIGGNDLMKVVKRDLFELKEAPFYKELDNYVKRLDELYGIIRGLNGDAIIIAAGLYNPLSIVTDESTEFDDIITDWNKAIEARAMMDGKSCFVPVTDLFDSNVNMVYHTDFFHPNAKGYEEMTARYLEEIERCGLDGLSNGQLDIQGAE